MSLTDKLVRYGGARLSRRVTRAMPLVGAAVGVATLAATMKRKGMFRGVLDTGLNAMPFVGAAKNVIELARGRDFFPDRTVSVAHRAGERPPSESARRRPTVGRP